MTLSQLPARTLPSRLRVVAAFAAIYVIWGSTYLAIRIAVETFSPFLLGAMRFLIAGGGPYLILKLLGTAEPTPRQWIHGAAAGGIMLVGGNGLVNWAEQRVPSNLAAPVIASAPVWFMFFDWIRPGGHRPAGSVWAGIVLGLGGVGYLLLCGGSSTEGPGFDPRGMGLLLVATVCWAGGSTLAWHTDRPASPWMAAAVHMTAAGVDMLGLSRWLDEGAGSALESI
jgi:drug/metabolite transporter (DMT)-like permease